jgi:hypothetical protein
MKGTSTMLHAIILALVFGGCVNCPPNGIIATNTVTQTIGTNILASAVMSNGTLVVTADAPSNQVNAVSSFIGTNTTPSQLIINSR